jgi:serine/threonine protein phosphatase PrpC
MIYYSRTDKGKIRRHNEDFVYAPKNNDGNFAVVADGMGGHKAGEVASKLVVDTITKTLKDVPPENITEEVLSNTLISANKNVWNQSHSDRRKEGMGSTATVAVFNGSKAIVGHVGDSRAYLFRKGVLSQITKDHSYVQMLVDNGIITKSEASKHPSKNIITRAVGTDEELDVDIYIVPLKKDDMILLCSDGLNIAVSDSDIETILGRGAEYAVDGLVEAALKNGGSDNISVALACVDGDSA